MLPQRTTQQGLEQDRSATQLLKEGVVAFKAGNKDHARDLIAEAAELDPGNELVWMWSASTARNRDEALSALGRALEINPNNAKARQWVERLSPGKKSTSDAPSSNGASTEPKRTAPDAPQQSAPAAPQAKAATAVAAPAVVAVPPAQRPAPAPEKPAPILAPRPPRKSWDDDGDPLRALMRNRLGLPEEKQEAPAEAAETDQAEPQAEQPPSADAKTADAPEQASQQDEPPQQAQQSSTADQTETVGPAAEQAAAPTRPISQQTCLLCAKQSLNDGVCGFCRAVGDLGQLDEISRNESVDRTAMLAAVERFRKELEAGPSFEANLGLALAYLNLKQSNDALPRLAEAYRLQPGNAQLRRQYEQLRARRLILVVDDSKTVQRMIAGVLEKSLYRVALAEDGLQALARLDDETPSLILLDITMPRMDGYQVAKIITGNDATASIPVVMLSGKDGFFDRIRGKMVGAKGYVTKPFDPDELIETIQRCMDS